MATLHFNMNCILPLLWPKPYKHPKPTKLNPNTPWLKHFFLKKHWLLFIFYLPWIILYSWKSNTSYFSETKDRKIYCCIGPLHMLHIMGDVLWPAWECFISSKYIGSSIVCTLNSRTCCRHLFCYNNTIEEDDYALLSSFFSLTTRRRQRH
jgi:hypothetical protein